MSDQRCGLRRFWPLSPYAEINGLADSGLAGGPRSECRRHSPSPSWPWTDAGSWCGDFEGRAAAERSPSDINKHGRKYELDGWPMTLRELNTCKHLGVRIAADLAKLRRRDVALFPNAGIRTVQHFEAWLSARGLSWTEPTA